MRVVAAREPAASFVYVRCCTTRGPGLGDVERSALAHGRPSATDGLETRQVLSSPAGRTTRRGNMTEGQPEPALRRVNRLVGIAAFVGAAAAVVVVVAVATLVTSPSA